MLEPAAGFLYKADVASDFEIIFSALADAQVRYLTVGGVAVVLHGAPRFTADLDLVLDLEPNNLDAALNALAALGYRPRAPVQLLDFADPEKRRDWIANKGLTVFSLWSSRYPATEVDLFVQPPFAFDETFGRAVRADLGITTAIVISKNDLIAMKAAVGRPKDVEDVRVLSLSVTSSNPSDEGPDNE